MASSEVLPRPAESELEAQWRKALYEEDCLRVMTLLRENPSLLKHGWGHEPGQMVEGSRLNYWHPVVQTPWKGRTALHVGARRGCTELLNLAIRLCSSTGTSWDAGLSGGLSGPVTSRDAGSSTKQENAHSGCCLGTQDINCECPHAHLPTAVDESEDMGAYRKRKRLQLDNFYLSTSRTDVHQVDAPTSTIGPQTRARLSNLVQQSVLVAKQEMSYGDFLQRRAMAELAGIASVNGAGFSEDDMVALLRARDGEYEMDALAMAAVSGNVGAIDVLLEASFVTEANPYAVSLVPNRAPLPDPEIRNRYRGQLRAITDKTIARFSRDHFFDKVVLDSYRKHRDFNFLPREEYLFHFMFTDCFHRAGGGGEGTAHHYSWEETEVELLGVLTDLWIEICQLWPSPWVFLLELQDAQGRTPLHVAVDENTCQRFFNLLRAIEQEPVALDGRPAAMLVSGPLVGENTRANLTGANLRQNLTKVAACALQTRDGGGRTATHRAVTLGRREALLHIHDGMDEFGIDREDRVCGEAAWQHSILNVLMSRSRFRFDVDALSQRNGFEGLKGPEWIEGKSNMDYSMPLHSAIIHKRTEILELLLSELEGSNHRDVDLLFPLFLRYRGDEIQVHLEPLQLSVMVGDPSVVKRLVQWHQSRPPIPLSKGGSLETTQREYVGKLLSKRYEQVRDVMDCFVAFRLTRKFFKLVGCLSVQLVLAMVAPGLRVGDLWVRVHHGLETFVICALSATPFLTLVPDTMGPQRWPAVHLAAASGKADMLRLFVDSDWFDPFEEDCDGSSALHHAINGSEVEFYTHLLDYVDCAQILASRDERKRDFEERQGHRFLKHKTHVVERQRCVNLLLHTGCDIFKTNKERQAPCPRQDQDSEFILWWNKKRAKEFGLAFNRMNIAANSILVTAALVATASYVGPLQPPLGYDQNLLRLEYVWVKIFIVCDTMSFYLAVVTIICTLIMSFPMPEVPIAQQMRRTEFLVAEAVQFLSFSIVFVLLAFASSSIAVVRTHSGRLTTWTAIVGGGLCAIFLVWFFWQSFLFSFRRNGWTRTLFEVLLERIERSVAQLRANPTGKRRKRRKGDDPENEGIP